MRDMPHRERVSDNYGLLSTGLQSGTCDGLKVNLRHDVQSNDCIRLDGKIVHIDCRYFVHLLYTDVPFGYSEAQCFCSGLLMGTTAV